MPLKAMPASPAWPFAFAARPSAPPTSSARRRRPPA